MGRPPIVVGRLAKVWHAHYKISWLSLGFMSIGLTAGYIHIDMDRDRRRYLWEHHRDVMEVYYKVNFVLSRSGHRQQHDRMIWAAEDEQRAAREAGRAAEAAALGGRLVEMHEAARRAAGERPRENAENAPKKEKNAAENEKVAGEVERPRASDAEKTPDNGA